MNRDETGWSTIFLLLKSQRIRLVLTIVFALLAAFLELVPYWIFFKAIDLLHIQYLSTNNAEIHSTTVTEFYNLAALMLITLIAKTVTYGIAYTFSHQAAFLVMFDVRKTLVTKLAYAPLTWLQDYHSGQLKQAILQDLEKLENFIAHHSLEVSVAIFGPALVTLYLFWIDWRLALAALLAAPAAFLSSIFVMRGMSKHYDQYHQASQHLNNTTVEFVRNMPVMKLFRQDTKRFQVMSDKLQSYYGSVETVTRLTVPRWALFTSLLGASVLFVLPLGVYLHATNDTNLMHIVMAVILSAGMLKPLLKISNFFTEIQEVLSGVRRLVPILNALDSRAFNKSPKINKNIRITLENVDFSYDQKPVLTNINLTIQPGETTIILGMSGSGKSSLAQLIAGVLKPDRGRILLNETALDEFSDAQRAAMISLASQDIFLFKGTLRENLKLVNPEVSDEAIFTALKVAQADVIVNEFSGGLNTKLNEQGNRLSEGEKQRITLARTLLVNAPIIVLDEATAFADSVTQRNFYHSLNKHYPDKTVIIIAHRTYGMEEADQIVIMENGGVIATGQHMELLKTQPFYRHVCNLQVENEKWALGKERDVYGETING